MAASASGSDPLAVYSIGLKLRTLRATRRLTLARLSAQTGYSTALLSKLETDRMIPTLHTLEKICRVYGITLGHFFCEPQHHSLSVARREHIAHSRRAQPAPLHTPLHMPTADGKQVSEIVDLPPNASSSVGECGTVSELTAYVLDGALDVSIAGATEAAQQGDCIVVRTDQLLVLSTNSSPCRLLVVTAK